MMTREQALKLLEYPIYKWSMDWDEREDGLNYSEAIELAISALRPVSREQVEKMRGEWIIEDAGDGDRRKKCSLCNQPISGWWGRDRFCANCGSPMTEEAVDMVMEMLEGTE